MIEFSGMDIIVKQPMPDEHVRQALASALRVSPERIALIDDVSHYPDRQDVDIVCVSSSVEGEFAQLISIQVGRATLPYETTAQLMQLICEQLGTQYITPDDENENPYVMWVVSPGALPRRIGLDPVALDNGRYVISR